METVTISISMPKDVVKIADKRAEEVYKSRSEYIKDLILTDDKQAVLPL